jgi:hypothetical protein
MRKDLIDSLLLGGAIALVALALHALTDEAAPHYQLLALALAAVLLFAIQLGLARHRARSAARPADESADEEPPFKHNPRNPFFRELTSDWTGLDERPPAEPPADSNGEAAERQGAEQGK